MTTPPEDTENCTSNQAAANLGNVKMSSRVRPN